MPWCSALMLRMKVNVWGIQDNRNPNQAPITRLLRSRVASPCNPHPPTPLPITSPPSYLKPSNSLTLWMTNTKFYRFIRHGIEGLMQFNLCEFEIVLIIGIYEDEADILARLIEVSDWKLSCFPICNQLPVIAEHCGSINRWSISQRHFHSKQVALSQLASRQMLKQISNETFVWLKHNMGGGEGCLLDNSAAYRGLSPLFDLMYFH